MRKIQEEFGKEFELEWKSFLLRPQFREKRDLDKFKVYTQGWKRPAAEEPEVTFRPWESNQGPPSHSVPPHLVAKAALTVSLTAFETIHERLLRAYFSENIDITDDEVLRGIWQQLDLPPHVFERRNDPALRETVFNEHKEAIDHGATGVPAFHIKGGVGVLMGAQPLEMLRDWIKRMRKNM